jgi:stress response protein SCP2
MPRGSVVPIDGNLLRFFMYWKQKHERTDYDLSVITLGESYEQLDQISWTNLRGLGAVHSGDLTDATNGASEFIDLDLAKIRSDVKYIVPSVNIFVGEDFQEVEESFFGFMLRDPAQEGKPFEPATVRMKSDVRGKGKVALPIVFVRENGSWHAKWLNLYLTGSGRFNRIEKNRVTTSLLVKAIVERQYLDLGYLTTLVPTELYTPGQALPSNAIFVGVEQPEGLPTDCQIYTLTNLKDLTPR